MLDEVLIPLATETEYRRVLRGLVVEQAEAVLREARRAWPVLLADTRVDALETARDWSAGISAIIDSIRRVTQAAVLRSLPVLYRIYSRVNESHKKVWDGAVRQRYGQAPALPEIWLPPLREAWLRENTRLVNSLTDDARSVLQGSLTRALLARTPMSGLPSIIRDRTTIDNNRADLISRDQTSGLASQLNERRQREFGVNRYRWRTARDERVRPTHRFNAEKIFSWDRPPSATGHPGHDVNCRCVAIPIFPTGRLRVGE